jgi:OOP family OmpA-OmpF porin
MRSICTAALAFAAYAIPIVALTATPADAQILRGIRRAAERAAERETERQVDKVVTETIRCAVGDSACADRARREGKKVEMVDSNGNVTSQPAADASSGDAGSAESTPFLNFDFVPGERVLFTDDYTRDNVGDFPRRLEFVKGNMEIAEWRGTRWVRATSWPSEFAIVLPENLPGKFTVEMDVVPGRNGQNAKVVFDENAEQWVSMRYFSDRIRGGISTSSAMVAEGEVPYDTSQPFTIRIMADGAYTKVYANGTRIANVPNSKIGRSNRILVELPGTAETPAYVGAIRVAAGGRDLYDALSAEGRVATQGVFFDTGSDRIRPESAPTLKEIGDMLRQHADLKLTIEGHTDSVGDDAANMSLSERRAAAVKAYLESQFGIPSDRLQAVGMGETKPAASNDTPEGRQQNRRVELVRQ